MGLATFAGSLKSMVSRSSSQAQWRKIVETLRTEPVDESTDLGKVTDQVLGKITNRALFVIISDFFEDAETIRQALARFRHRRHDVMLLNTLDRQEMQFSFTQPAPFEGLEDDGRLRVDPRALRAGLSRCAACASRLHRAHRDRIRFRCAPHRHPCVGRSAAGVHARAAQCDPEAEQSRMTFVTAGLALAGVVSTSIPILIFLLWRQRRKPVPWAAMRFLLEAYRKHRRRMRLEQLLLLAIRCLIVLLLGAALARPVLDAAGLLDDGGRERVVYIVLDNGVASASRMRSGNVPRSMHFARTPSRSSTNSRPAIASA